MTKVKFSDQNNILCLNACLYAIKSNLFKKVLFKTVIICTTELAVLTLECLLMSYSSHTKINFCIYRLGYHVRLVTAA